MGDRTVGPPPQEDSASAGPEYRYTAFGLVVSSCIRCPELFDAAGRPDVTVKYGAVSTEYATPIHAGGLRSKATPGKLTLEVDQIARFLVRDGTDIVIDRHGDANDDDVRLFLLGSSFGALLHQRGVLVLHGSTIRVGDGCVVFLGRRGAGKSTLAAALARRGYVRLGDDVCAISIGEDGVPYAAPAYPQAKLWLDSLEHLGLDATTLRRVRPTREKRAVPFEGDPSQNPLPVKGLYVLSPSKDRTDIAIGPIRGPIKIRALRDYTYRLQFLKGFDLARHHFAQITHVASRLPMIRVMRPAHGALMEQVAMAVERDLRSSIGSGDQAP